MLVTVMIFVTLVIAALMASIVVVPQIRSDREAETFLTGMSRTMNGGDLRQDRQFDDKKPDDMIPPPFPEEDGSTEPSEVPAEERNGDMPFRDMKDINRRELEGESSLSIANMITVTLGEDGSVSEWSGDREELYENEDIASVAAAVLDKKSDFGRCSGFYYLKNAGGENEDRILLLDNHIAFENSRRTLIITCISGVCAWGLFLALMIYAVHKMTAPVKTAIDKQRRFISDAGHELKTPVAVIKANSEVLRSEIGQNKWLDHIGTESDRMNRLISDLMMLAEIDDPTENSVHVRFDLSGTVEGTALPFESLAFENGILLVTDVEPDIYMIGNSSRIEELVSIFINNAIKYGEKEIKISLKKDHKNARLTVYNKGKGISPEERDKIFERFYRVDKDRSRKSGNYGLGLAIAASIAEEHGSSIAVGGEYGKDVSFTVVFKRAE